MSDTDDLFRRVTRRFVPLLFVSYVFNYMDRTNIGFAQLQMKSDLGLSDVAYGIGASMLFVSYTLCGLPCNLVLARIGVRWTMLGCLVGLGLTSALTLFVRTRNEFYVCRFLLGAFEGGFLPGIIFFFGKWFPSQRRARVIGLFMSATVVSGVVSGFASGAILNWLSGWAGLRGWQWLFVMEGLPSVFLGVAAFFLLDDEPRRAKWLSEPDKALIADALADDAAAAPKHSTIGQALRDGRVYLFGLVFFLVITVAYVLAFWQPRLIKDFKISNVMAIGVLSTIPSLAAVVAKIWVPLHSDKVGERRWHFAVSALAGAAGLALLVHFSYSPLTGIVCLVLATAGAHGCIPVFWAVPGDYLKGDAAATGIAVISMMGTIGGIVGPPMLGYIHTLTGSFAYGMYAQSGFLAASAALMMVAIAPNGPLAARSGKGAWDDTVAKS